MALFGRPQSGAFFVCINMKGFILGQKGEMEQMFDEAGVRIPVTHILTGNCYLVDLVEYSGEGFWSIKLGFGQTKNIKKPLLGVLKKAGIGAPLRFLREIRLNEKTEILQKDRKGVKLGENEFYTGDVMRPDLIFKKGDMLTVSGTSKGKGFAGVVKRHHFKGGPRTHGQSDRERAPGSIGQTTTPGRVYKGKRMAGRMGSDTVSVKNLKVVEVADGEIVVKGLVPGAKGGLLICHL